MGLNQNTQKEDKRNVIAILFSLFVVYLFSCTSSCTAFRELYLQDITTFPVDKSTLLEIVKFNEQKAQAIQGFKGKLSTDYTNFASIRVYYRIKGKQSFNYIDVPKNIFFTSTEQKVGDPILISQWKEQDNIAEIFNSYKDRGNIDTFKETTGFREFGWNKETLQCKIYTINFRLSNNVVKETEFFYPLDQKKGKYHTNLYKWSAGNPLFSHDLIHSEQQFFNYYLLGKNSSVLNINKEVIDCIIINIISPYAACELCFTALQNLLTNKNNLKIKFIKQAFPHQENSVINIPIHILYYTINPNSTYRKKQRDMLKDPLLLSSKLDPINLLNEGNFIQIEPNSFSQAQKFLNNSPLSEENINVLRRIAEEKGYKDVDAAFTQIYDGYINHEISKPTKKLKTE